MIAREHMMRFSFVVVVVFSFFFSEVVCQDFHQNQVSTGLLMILQKCIFKFCMIMHRYGVLCMH